MFRVTNGRYVYGALRYTDEAVALPPYPARPIVATARVHDGWLFAAADGTVFHAAEYLATLRVIAALPAAAHPSPVLPADDVARAVHADGALVYVDVRRHATRVDAGGAVRVMPLDAVLSCTAEGDEVWAVTEPGVLQHSSDAGQTFRAVPVPAGAAVSVARIEDTVMITTTQGRYRWQEGAVQVWEDAPDAAAWITADPEARAARDTHPVLGMVLPDDPRAAAARPDGTLLVVEGDDIVAIDPRTRHSRGRGPAPGSNCELHASGRLVRAVCAREGAMRAVWSETPEGTWTLLRDETRGDPMGELVFDDHAGGWAVHAPCVAAPTPDPTAVCVYDDRGGQSTVRMGFDALPVAMHDGVLLVIDRTARGDRTRAALVRGGTLSSLALSVPATSAAGGHWAGASLRFWVPSSDALTLVQLTATRGGGYDESRHAAPRGAERGIAGPGGDELVFGRDGDALWRTHDGVSYTRLPSPVAGSATALRLDPTARSYCAGRTCRVAGALEFTDLAAGAAPLVARRDAAPTDDARPAATHPRPLVCAHGEITQGPVLDRGVAVSGYVVDAVPNSAVLRVTWTGEDLRGTLARPALPRATQAQLAVYGVMGATFPTGMVEHCAGDACGLVLLTRMSARALDLPTWEHPRGRDISLGLGGHVVARTWGSHGGQTAVSSTRFDGSTGDEDGRQLVVTDALATDVYAGAFEGVEGLWVTGPDRRMRFHPMQGTAPTVAVPERDGDTPVCAPSVTTRGVVRRSHDVVGVRGVNWVAEGPHWRFEETLAVVGDRLCVQRVMGGDADEAVEPAAGEAREPVRTFMLTATEGAAMTGYAWTSRRRIALRCTQP